MNSKDHLLAIDYGTQSVRALLFDARGNLVSKARVEVEPYFSDNPGWAEQDPAAMWQWLCEACQTLWKKSPVARDAVAAVALTTQRATMINVDEMGEPLRPAILWLDQRRCEGLDPLGGVWGLAFRAVRMRETVAHFQAEADANWLRLHQPEIWTRTHKYLFLSGFLTHRLVGRSWTRPAARWATCPSTTRSCGGPPRATGSGKPCPSPAGCCPTWCRRASRWGDHGERLG